MTGTDLGFRNNDISVRCVDLIADDLRVFKVKIQQTERIEFRLSILRHCFKAEPVLIIDSANAESRVCADWQRSRSLFRVVQFVFIAVQQMNLHGTRYFSASRLVKRKLICPRLACMQKNSSILFNFPTSVPEQRECRSIRIIKPAEGQGDILSGLFRRDRKAIRITAVQHKLHAVAVVQLGRDHIIGFLLVISVFMQSKANRQRKQIRRRWTHLDRIFFFFY